MTTTYTYNAANELVTAQQGSNTWNYTYDANGSLISDGVKTYTYDSANRLVEVSDQLSVTSLSYNGLGQRLSMTSAGVTSTYVMDGDRPLTAESAGNTTFYLYGLGGIGEKTTTWNFSLPDGTNTPRQLTDAQGEITLSSRYTPWGDTLDTYGTGNFSFGYLGGVLDATTGLLYVGNGQYYDPSTGRFLTRDVNPNSTNPYVPWNPIGAIVGPLGLIALVFGRKKKGSKAGTFLVLVLVVGSVGMTLAGCITAEDIGITPTDAPIPVTATATQTQGVIDIVVSTPTQTVTATVLAPTEMPELGCPAPLSFAQDEGLKMQIETEFGITFGGRLYGTEEWPSVHIQIVYGALSRINVTLGGNLKSMLGQSAVFHHIKNELGDGNYEGYTRSTGSIEFYVVNTFPYHLIYHEMGHLLNNAQGQRYTNSLDSTVVYTDYPNQTGERVMGGTPYNRIDGEGYISLRLQDPCGASVKAELHPASDDGNNAGEEWGDLFANYVSGNFNIIDPIGIAKYNWVKYQLFGG